MGERLFCRVLPCQKVVPRDGNSVTTLKLQAASRCSSGIAQALTYGRLICLLSGLMMSLDAMYLPFRSLGASFFHRERSSLEALLRILLEHPHDNREALKIHVHPLGEGG